MTNIVEVCRINVHFAKFQNRQLACLCRSLAKHRHLSPFTDTYRNLA
jgi:hypothetical protein